MCVWSAYAGTAPAAPKLWESLGKIEGLWGGFYTGMVTVDNGKLHWKKCAGHMGIWEERFSLNDFKGCTGLVHSRTNAGGDDRRAHPYVGASAQAALVEQGRPGIFRPVFAEIAQKIGNSMLERGRVCRTDIADDSGFIPLADGGKVCFGDVVVNAAEEEYLRSHDPLAAIRNSCGVMPEEYAAIFVFADRPGFIGFANVDQHVVCSFNEDGVWLSVSALGVPGFAMEIPGNSLGYVTSDGEFHREELSALYAPVNTKIPEGIFDAFVKALKEQPGEILGHYFNLTVKPRFKGGELDYHMTPAWRCLENLQQERHLRFEPEIVPGCSGAPGRVWKIYYC